MARGECGKCESRRADHGGIPGLAPFLLLGIARFPGADDIPVRSIIEALKQEAAAEQPDRRHAFQHQSEARHAIKTTRRRDEIETARLGGALEAHAAAGFVEEPFAPQGTQREPGRQHVEKTER
jgi:hypothetical protein